MPTKATLLRRGYSTGVHTSFAFASALEGFVATQKMTQSITYKMDNDDLDVTKGCEIIVTVSDSLKDLECNRTPHQPYKIANLRLYAGMGVGIVTKEGLKPPKGYPAINPVPLKAIKEIYSKSPYASRQDKILYATVSVTKGETLAKQTANAKVGVVGGISILGTTGFVKPVSSSAYIDSIRTEMEFIKANGYEKVVLTLGNSSFAHAKEHYKEEQIVEIGNFVYDAIQIASELALDKVLFICGIGKMTKIAQGFKNTHNKFGTIDFKLIQNAIAAELNISIDIEATKTVKGITQQLDERADAFYKMIQRDANRQIKEWFPLLEVETIILR